MATLSIFNFCLDEYVSIMTALYCMNPSFADMVEDLTEFGPDEWDNYRERMLNTMGTIYGKSPCTGALCGNPTHTRAQQFWARHADMDAQEELDLDWDADDAEDDRDVHWRK